MMAGNLRASDADREAVVTLLSQALAEGRITLEEFDGRVESAYAAKTHAELDALMTDLPHSIW